VDDRERQSAEQIRSLIERGRHEPARFGAALLDVAPTARDAWLDVVLGLGELPDDGPDLPKDCVPYLPCPVDALLRMVDHARVRASDVFVDVGSGVGRAAALVHLLTGATVIGLEIQHSLVVASRELAAQLGASRFSTIEGDAMELTRVATSGSVFFLYCPFSGVRLANVLANLEPIARTRMLRVCCVDLPLQEHPWLVLDPQRSGDLAIYWSTLHGRPFGAEVAQR
jgi:hypothetical protein